MLFCQTLRHGTSSYFANDKIDLALKFESLGCVRCNNILKVLASDTATESGCLDVAAFLIIMVMWAPHVALLFTVLPRPLARGVARLLVPFAPKTIFNLCGKRAWLCYPSLHLYALHVQEPHAKCKRHFARVPRPPVPLRPAVPSSSLYQLHSQRPYSSLHSLSPDFHGSRGNVCAL